MPAVWGLWPVWPPAQLGALMGREPQGPSEQPGPPDRVLHCDIPLRGPRCAAGAWSAAAWSLGRHHLLSQA
jgi:hypothetical protein